MREKSLRRYALFFLVILLVQDFAHLRYVSRPTQLRLEGERQKRDTSAENSVATLGKSRRRRWVTAVLLGVALLATTVSIATEITLAIEGCCLPNPKTCDYNKEYQQTKTAIETTVKSIDNQWVESQIKLIWIERTNNANERLWNQMERITNALEKIIFGISPTLEKEMTLYNEEIKKAAEAGNATVTKWDNVALSTNYKTYFTGDWKPITARVAGYAFLGGSFVFTLAMQRARYRAMQTFALNSANLLPRMSTQPKALALLGGGDPKALLNEAIEANRLATTSKTKFQQIKTVGGNLLNLGLIGVEIWLTIEKFKACDTIEKTAREARDGILVDKKEVDGIYTQVSDYNANLTTTYNGYVKDQLVQEGVLQYLRDIKNITQNASPDEKLTTANGWIDTYLAKIQTSNEEETYDLVTNLTSALQRVEFTIDCFENKVASINAIRSRCKSGSGTLQEIYDEVVAEYSTNSGPCTDTDKIPYTSFTSVSETINDYAVQEGFYAECKLNNEMLQGSVCSDVCGGFPDSTIATNRGITVAQLATLKTLCPAECPIPPAIVASICNMKTFAIPLSSIIGAWAASYSTAQITEAYNSCP